MNHGDTAQRSHNQLNLTTEEHRDGQTQSTQCIRATTKTFYRGSTRRTTDQNLLPLIRTRFDKFSSWFGHEIDISSIEKRRVAEPQPNLFSPLIYADEH